MPRLEDYPQKKPRSDARNWRKFLLPDERAKLIKLEKIIQKADKMAEIPRLLKHKIQNRATARAGKAER
jgi:DNA relaxase NicK